MYISILFHIGPIKKKGPKPTKSALKRKYADISDGESDDGDKEETASDDVAVDKRQEDSYLSQGHGMLKPKNLFGTSFINTLQPKRPSLGRYHSLSCHVLVAKGFFFSSLSSLFFFFFFLV